MTRRDEIRSRIMARIEERDCGYATPCWLWTGPDSGSNGRGAGYPRMSLNGQTVAVHIVLYTNEYGFVPGKKQLDHLCRQRLCVRPDHMEIVTNRKNTQRAWDAKKADAEACQ
ncbi:MAG: HNH endonuclease [Xanthobacteraceae bacterium]|nr:HNH endonuclease [Xanthobacteraceae bacterium]